MSGIVLDASALIALLNDEPGSKIVEKELSHAIISSVNIAEVASFFVLKNIPAQEIQSIISDLAIEIIPFDKEQAFISAELRKKTKEKGLSLGDRACLSLAVLRNLPVLTADKAWKNLSMDIKIHIIR